MMLLVLLVLLVLLPDDIRPRHGRRTPEGLSHALGANPGEGEKVLIAWTTTRNY
jgi:hypothetical protein